jgi:hypothetical protein
VDLTTLRADPYYLVLDDSIFIKIVSINSYGESIISQPGNGAKLQLVPDAPTISNNVDITSATNIGLVFTPGASDGGTEILDYRLYFKHINDADFTVLESALTNTDYTTSIILQVNELYQFKLLSRNSVGYSLESDVVTIRSAKIPDTPTDLETTTVQDYSVIVAWTPAYNGGSPLLAY